MRLRALARYELSVVLVAALVCGRADAQVAGYVSGFEGVAASPGGTDLWDPTLPAGTLGQDQYYWPPGTLSVPFGAFSYTGNTLGVPPNPNGGGAQFIAGTGPGTLPSGATFARAQRSINYGANTGPWTFGFDMLVGFSGTLPAAQNIGSLSLQPFPGSQSFIALATWTDPTTAANWNAGYVWYDNTGAQVTATIPDPAFQNLAVGQWYRWETEVDLVTNAIVKVRIIDLSTNVATSHEPSGAFMGGGDPSLPGNPAPVPPTGIRFFAGSTTAGNFVACDNADFCPGWVSSLPPSPMPTPCVGPCCYPADSFVVLGMPKLGGNISFLVDYGPGVIGPGPTPGASFALTALSLGIGPLPCGVLFPGITGNLLIGLPPAQTLFSGAIWAGPGSPVTFTIVMPATSATFLIGASFYAQGAFLDVPTSGVFTTQGAAMRLGG